MNCILLILTKLSGTLHPAWYYKSKGPRELNHILAARTRTVDLVYDQLFRKFNQVNNTLLSLSIQINLTEEVQRVMVKIVLVGIVPAQ